MRFLSLPHVKELSSLSDRGCQNPAIDAAAFPGTPASWHWSSSPYAGNASYAWDVNFSNGDVGSNDRGYSHVRLVRTSQ